MRGSRRSHAAKKSPVQLQREIDEALGYTPDDYSISRARNLYGGWSAAELRRELGRLERQFQKAGGRGVDLADRIDAIRIALALK